MENLKLKLTKQTEFKYCWLAHARSEKDSDFLIKWEKSEDGTCNWGVFEASYSGNNEEILQFCRNKFRTLNNKINKNLINIIIN